MTIRELQKAGSHIGNLVAWQKAMDFAIAIYEVSRSYPTKIPPNQKGEIRFSKRHCSPLPGYSSQFTAHGSLTCSSKKPNLKALSSLNPKNLLTNGVFSLAPGAKGNLKRTDLIRAWPNATFPSTSEREPCGGCIIKWPLLKRQNWFAAPVGPCTTSSLISGPIRQHSDIISAYC
jgi:hypothetical protein